jgi:hypothetical protein
MVLFSEARQLATTRLVYSALGETGKSMLQNNRARAAAALSRR